MQYTNTNDSIEVRSEADYDQISDRNAAIVDKGLAALNAGDVETSDVCLRQMYRSAEELLSIKHILGADWIRRKRIDTTPAEQKYGRDWLDRDI